MNKIYYAHHLYKYNTKIEEYELDLIKNLLAKYEILNPNGDIEHDDLKNEAKIMEKCLSCISDDNIMGTVFSSVDGVVGKGVYDEVNHTKELNKEIYYIFNNTIIKLKDVKFTLTNKNNNRFYAIVDELITI